MPLPMITPWRCRHDLCSTALASSLWLCFSGFLGAAPQASAEALSLDAIDTFIQYRVCANAPDNSTCLDACVAPEATWDKNKDTNFTNLDLIGCFGILGRGFETYICYRSRDTHRGM